MSANKIEEQQCILRVPPELASKIHTLLQNHDTSKDSSKLIELDLDIAFGDDPSILQFLKSAIISKPKKDTEKNNNKDSNSQMNGSGHHLHHNSTNNNNNNSTNNSMIDNNDDDDGYISDVEYTIKKHRRGRLRFRDEYYPCELLDMPCIIEAYKSIDYQTYFKAGDVSQMILVKTREQLDKELNSMKRQREAASSMDHHSATTTGTSGTHNTDHHIHAHMNKLKKKKRKRLLLSSMSGITPSTHNIYHHYEARTLDASKSDIKHMVDQFNEMTKEDEQDVIIEVLTDKEDEFDDFSSDTDSSSGSSDDEDSSDEDRPSIPSTLASNVALASPSTSSSAMTNKGRGQRQSFLTPYLLGNRVTTSTSSPSMYDNNSTSDMASFASLSQMNDDSFSGHSDDDAVSVASSTTGPTNFAAAFAQSGGLMSSMLGGPVSEKSPTSSTFDEDSRSDAASEEEEDDDEEMFESMMNVDDHHTMADDDDEEEEEVASPELVQMIDKHRLVERRNAVAISLEERQRELEENERQHANTPNPTMKNRFLTRINDIRSNIDEMKQELAQIDQELGQ